MKERPHSGQSFSGKHIGGSGKKLIANARSYCTTIILLNNLALTSSGLLPTPLQLSQSPLSDTLMHTAILIHGNRICRSNKGSKRPMHDAVTPKRSAGVSNTLRTSTSANFAKGSPDKCFWSWNGGARALDLGHGRGD